MVGWHHRLDGNEFEQAPGDSEGQGSLACCSPWGHKESDTTQSLNKNNCPTVGDILQQCILDPSPNLFCFNLYAFFTVC